MSERVEVYRVDPQPDEPLRGEVYAVPVDTEHEKVRRLEDERDRLLDRVAELERMLAEARA